MNLPDEKKADIVNVVSYTILSCRNYGLDKLKAIKPFTFVDITEAYDIPEQIESSKIMDKITEDIDNSKRWYHARIFLYCQQYGSILAFSQISRIPYRELREAYKEYKTYLKNWLTK